MSPELRQKILKGGDKKISELLSDIFSIGMVVLKAIK